MFIYLALCIFQLFQIDWSFYHIKFYIKEQFSNQFEMFAFFSPIIWQIHTDKKE